MADRQESRKMAMLDFVNEEHWGKGEVIVAGEEWSGKF